VINPEAESFFLARSAHDEVGVALIEALKPLGEYELRGQPGSYKSPYAVTRDTVFCGAADMTSMYFRLSPADRAIAIATGAVAAQIGPDWVRIELFRPRWPKPDCAHWALRAYVYAREGEAGTGRASPPPGPYRDIATCLHLEQDSSVTVHESGDAFWHKLSSGALPQLDRGRLATAYEFSEDWTTWEIHPAGEEVVMLLSGRAEFVLERGGGEERILLNEPGQFILVPRATWHTANTAEPTRMYFITPGEGTHHRPR
jgi:mannose-6-phosphate isomerase-like protein (cupin superfamily)